MRAVAGCRRDPRRNGPEFVDALLQHLAAFVLLVVGNALTILWHVILAVRIVDAYLPEQSLHPERTRLVGDNRDDFISDRLILEQDV